MSWRDDMQNAAIALLVKKGTLVTPLEEGDWRGHAYGWEDYETMRHVRPWAMDGDVKACRFIKARDVQEDYWSEFVDTFSGNREVTGIVCTVDCACGRISGRQLRFAGSIHDLLQELLAFTEDQEFDLTTNQEDET